ncbi:MAG: M1 family aminopeptidase [Acidobacteriota bacterium]
MKRIARFVFAVAISGATFGLPGQAASPRDKAVLDSYEIDLRLDAAAGRLAGRVVLLYTNNSGAALGEIPLRLDLNLGGSEAMTIDSVRDAGGRALAWRYEPFQFAKLSSDKARAVVSLPGALESGRSLTLEIDYRLQGKFLSQDMVMLQDDPFHSFDGWYPKAMTRAGGDWSIDDDRLSSFAVSLDPPADMAVASTGRVLEDASGASGRRLRLAADGVRGFTIYASRSWKRYGGAAGDVELGVFLPEAAAPWASKMLQAMSDSVVFFQTAYGAFPSGHLDLACFGDLSGAESGSFASYAVIGLFLNRQLEDRYRWFIAHEVAHQYFGAAVGLRRREIGWVPIGLGMMMDEHFLRQRGLRHDFDRKVMEDFYYRAERKGFDTTLSQPVEKPLAAGPPWSFGWNLALMHGKAYAVMSMLRDLLGEEAFRRVVRDIIAEKSGALIGPADLIARSEKALGRSLDWFVADWLDGRGTLDYAVAGVKRVDRGWQVDVRRLGPAAFPVTVQIETALGEKMRRRVDAEREMNSLVFETRDDIRSLVIDPGLVCPDIDASNNVWPSRP